MRAPEVVRAASSISEFLDGILGELFRGISLSTEQRAAARAVIADVVERQAQLDLRGAGGWTRLLRLNEERNAALAELLASDAARARFEANAAEAQLEQAEIAWRTQLAAGWRGAEVVPMLEVDVRADPGRPTRRGG